MLPEANDERMLVPELRLSDVPNVSRSVERVPSIRRQMPGMQAKKNPCCAWPTIQVEIRYDPQLRHQHAMVVLLTLSVIALAVGWLLLGNFFFCALFARLCLNPWDQGWWFRGLGGVLMLLLCVAMLLRCLCACFNCYHCVRVHVVEEE